jgi:N-acyl-D-aspartate/D-glutamate deacylase
MDKARQEGMEVACDMMVYRTSGSWWGPRAVLPKRLYDWHVPWEDNLAEVQEILRDPQGRKDLRAEIEHNRQRPKRGFDEEALIFSDWGDIHIEELPPSSPRSHLLGMDMVAAAAVEGQEPVDLFLDMLLEEGDEFGSVRYSKNPKDFRDFIEYDWSMFCTDTIGTKIERVGEPWNTIQPQRRHYGTYPRILAKFVRDEGVLSLEEAVRRMSALPADHFRLEGRGYIKEDYWADLVVVDMERVGEVATWRRPCAYPAGIDHVFVNGVGSVSAGQFTGQLGGRMLTCR